MIEIRDKTDFQRFKQFVEKHSEFVVKPSNYCYGVGVHKANISEYKSLEEAFDSILSEGIQMSLRHPSVYSSIVLEELIVQAKAIQKISGGESVNGIRATAVIDKNGELVILHPWMKCSAGGQFVASAALGGFDAEIDSDTGIVISDGYSENGKIYKVHPDTGIKIKGFQIPKWNELKLLVAELMKELPTYRYIGWDLVLTENGWVVMEANYSGEFMWQLIRQCGGRKEFEDIIGWKMEKDFWWQVSLFGF